MTRRVLAIHIWQNQAWQGEVKQYLVRRWADSSGSNAESMHEYVNAFQITAAQVCGGRMLSVHGRLPQVSMQGLWMRHEQQLCQCSYAAQ